MYPDELQNSARPTSVTRDVSHGWQSAARGRSAVMTEQPHDPPTGDAQEPATDDVIDPHDQPAAGGTNDGEPAQGEGAPDSY